jgi:hypothetical protein
MLDQHVMQKSGCLDHHGGKFSQKCGVSAVIVMIHDVMTSHAPQTGQYFQHGFRSRGRVKRQISLL